MGEPQDMAALAVAPICQHEIFALAERLGFQPEDNVQSIKLKPDQIEVLTINSDENGERLSRQGPNNTQEWDTTTHLFSYNAYGRKWHHDPSLTHDG